MPRQVKKKTNWKTEQIQVLDTSHLKSRLSHSPHLPPKQIYPNIAEQKSSHPLPRRYLQLSGWQGAKGCCEYQISKCHLRSNGDLTKNPDGSLLVSGKEKERNPKLKNMKPFTGHVLPIWMYRKYRIQSFIAYDFLLQNILVILGQMQNVGACCLEDLPGVVVVRCTPTTENSRRSKHNRHRYVRSIKIELGAIYVYILSGAFARILGIFHFT